MTIKSPHNQKLKEIRKLLQRRRWRERSGRFVAEGEDLLAAADAAGWQAIDRYCITGSGLAGTEVEAELLASASGLASGTRTLAVYEERWATAAAGPLCVYLHGVHDPGNVGAILRSAEAFEAASVVLGPECADPFGPKAVRASMGAVFTVPVVRDTDVGGLPGVKIALVPGEGVPLGEVMPAGSTRRNTRAAPRAAAPDVTLLIGAERDGLPQDVIEQADRIAHVPIRTNSLNAAMAATIGLYELRSRMAPR